MSNHLGSLGLSCYNTLGGLNKKRPFTLMKEKEISSIYMANSDKVDLDLLTAEVLKVVQQAAADDVFKFQTDKDED